MRTSVFAVDPQLSAAHEHRRSVSCIPLFDRAIVDGGRRDAGALFVAATWLWTRFNNAENVALAHILSENQLVLHNPGNLKEVDAVLRVAARELFDEVYRWCLNSPYAIVDDGRTDVGTINS